MATSVPDPAKSLFFSAAMTGLSRCRCQFAGNFLARTRQEAAKVDKFPQKCLYYLEL